MRRLMLALPALLISLPLRAQPTLNPGVRVRVYSSDSAVSSALREALTGRVSRSTPSSLLLVTDYSGLEVSVPSQSLLRIDLSAGHGTHALAGGVIGGLISGGGFVALACAFSNGSCRISNHVGGFLAYYAVGAIPGAVVGVAVGSRKHTAERWRTIWVRDAGGGRRDAGAPNTSNSPPPTLQ